MANERAHNKPILLNQGTIAVAHEHVMGLLSCGKKQSFFIFILSFETLFLTPTSVTMGQKYVKVAIFLTNKPSIVQARISYTSEAEFCEDR